MAAKKKTKSDDPVSVSISGSATLQENLDLDQRVIMILEGTVTNVGEKSTATKGHVQVRTIRCDSLLLAPDDVKEQLAIIVQDAKDQADGVQSIVFPTDDEGDFSEEPE